MIKIIILFIFSINLYCTPYNWNYNKNNNSLKDRISPPKNYKRVLTKKGSFGYWLQNIPLKKGKGTIYLYNNKKKQYQNFHVAIIDIDIGKYDLQQCADATIRLYAEYLYSIKKYSQIAFNFTNGEQVKYDKWRKGYRLKIVKNKIKWYKKYSKSLTYKDFRNYLNKIFMYAGTYSLSKELKSVDIGNLKIGDIIIEGGFPGHAVIIVDMAINKKTEEKIYLLAQSYMPAQNIHILKNFNNKKLSPWYSFKNSNKIITPEWNFTNNDFKKFPFNKD